MCKENVKETRISRFRTIVIFASVTITLTLTGCMQQEEEQNLNISDEAVHLGWRQTIGAMGYVTVHPPQEDVRVGDLLFCSAKSSGFTANEPRYLLSATRWSMVDVGKLLEEEYTQRGEWPATPEMYYHVDENPGSREWLEARETGGQSIFTNTTPPTRLRSVAAGLIAASWDQAGNNVLVPTEAINMAMGTAWQDAKSVSYRVGSAEEYSLSIDKVIPVALEKRGEGKDARFFLNDEYTSNLQIMNTNDANAVHLALVNEVLYIRSLDISVQAQKATNPDAATSTSALTVSVESTPAAQAPPAPAPSDTPVDVNDPNATPAAPTPVPPAPSKPAKKIELSGQSVDPGLASYMRAQALNKSIMGADYDDLPDVFTRFISVSDESVALRKIWRRGLAIGVKGLVLEVDKYTGEVLSTSPMITFTKP